jgi:hypothetical protein
MDMEKEEGKSFVDARFFRDLLALITRHVSFETWGRLKCSCRTFNAALTLQNYAPLQMILKFTAPPEVNAFFFPLLRRFLWQIRVTINALRQEVTDALHEAQQLAHLQDQGKVSCSYNVFRMVSDTSEMFRNMEKFTFDEVSLALELKKFREAREDTTGRHTKFNYFMIPRLFSIKYPQGDVKKIFTDKWVGNIFYDNVDVRREMKSLILGIQ